MHATAQSRPRSFTGGRQRGRRPSLLALVLALVAALLGGYLTAGVAQAATVYEFEGDWEANTPGTVARGDVVTAVWRINVNDDQPAPGNDPVDNVTFTVTLNHGLFKTLPDLCKTDDGLNPKSVISEDGKTLTCNLGTVKQGTALVVQSPVVVDGLTGDQLTATGEIAGQEVPLDPIDIKNTFKMDLHFGTNSASYRWNRTNTQVTGDLQWSLRLGKGSDPGRPNQTFRIRVTELKGHPVGIGTHYTTGAAGCTPFDFGTADGHPWSELPPRPGQVASFVDSCTLRPVAGRPGYFDLTLTGINYDLAKTPTKDSTGRALPPDWDYIASGSLFFRSNTNEAGAFNLTIPNPPRYASTTGLTHTESGSVELGNNKTDKVFRLPGTFSAHWWRGYTGSGGGNWEDNYRVSAGTTVSQIVNNNGGKVPLPANSVEGSCLVFDSRFVQHVDKPTDDRWPDLAQIRVLSPNNQDLQGDPLKNPPRIQYYVGNGSVRNPDQFNCSSDPGNWTTTKPANPASVRAIRIQYRHSLYAAEGAEGFQLLAYTKLNDNLRIGQDVWMFGSALRSGQWVGIGEPWLSSPAQETPNARYPFTNGRRDILRTIFATPHITKAGDRSVVRAGEPAAFTLTYSANGSGAIPATVDNYRIVDTLPVGMTYVKGSATPEPAVTTSQGRQVLTWVLNKVPTNQQNTLVYQAVAGPSVKPGQTLTNSATATLRGESSTAQAQVTTSTSGYTEIGKSADQWFINNPDGSGDGEGAWTVNLRSVDPLPQAFTDTIDILPYNGDKRGTKFAGSYDVASVTAIAGARVYYTTADPEDLSDDPKDDSNGTAGNVAGNTVGWTQTKPDHPTAIRVIGPSLAPGAAQAFKINIVTDGADPGDTWVNRAQARAGHTVLVMRTSAPITMGTKYSASLKKYIQDAEGEWHDANDAADYPSFKFGSELNYRIVVTNTGQGTLTDVEVKDDKYPELGSFKIDSLAPGKSESHEFTVKLTEDNQGVVNTACAAAAQPEDTEEAPDINCDPAGFTPINYDTVKSSDKDGAPVGPGEVINYTIKVTQEGAGPATGAIFSDDLADVLDDATYNNDAKASIGTVEYGEGVIGWTGDVGVGEVATITYSVTVKNAAELGDKATGEIYNPVTSPGCEVIDGQTPNCDTKSMTGWYTYSKVSDPKTGAPVSPGEKVSYTIKVNHEGKAPAAGASIDDDVTDVIDDATYNNDAKASSGKASYTDGKLTWSGNLAVDQVVTITYTVTVIETGDDDLTNPVTTTDERGVCDEAVGCKVEHPKGRYLYSKVSDPKSGATVESAGVINYTITVTQQGKAPINGATLTDDLAKVLDDAEYNGDVKASVGTATVEGGTLSWKGDLAVGAVETITYSVTVIDDGDTQLINGVTTDDPRGACDEPVGCQVEHDKAPTPGGELPETGSPAPAGLAAGLGMLSLLTGGLVLAIRRRRVGGDRH